MSISVSWISMSHFIDLIKVSETVMNTLYPSITGAPSLKLYIFLQPYSMEGFIYKISDIRLMRQKWKARHSKILNLEPIQKPGKLKTFKIRHDHQIIATSSLQLRVRPKIFL